MNLTTKPELVEWGGGHYLYFEEAGDVGEIAPRLWNELSIKSQGKIGRENIQAMLGLSRMHPSKEDVIIYQAGFLVGERPKKMLEGFHYRELEKGRYAFFVLKGSYDQISPAFGQIFKTLRAEKIEFREEAYCIENYLNTPESTPVDELETELLIPIL